MGLFKNINTLKQEERMKSMGRVKESSVLSEEYYKERISDLEYRLSYMESILKTVKLYSNEISNAVDMDNDVAIKLYSKPTSYLKNLRSVSEKAD